MNIRKNKTGISKSEAFIAMFMTVLVVTMPVVFTAIQPEIINGEIKQNSSVDFISSTLKDVVSFFNPFNLIPSVSADSDFGCCPTTKTGARYQPTMLDECNVTECENPGQISPPCWQRNQSCSLGCCINTQGLCIQNTFQEGCATGSFIPNDATCTSISLCGKACCIKGMQSFMATNFTCFLKGGVWDQGTTNELDCLSIMEKERLGCCKSFAGCEYITRQECKESRLGTFFADKKCYDNVPQCDCTKLPREKGKCIDGFPDKYFVDTCNNIYIDEEPAQRCGGFCDISTNKCETGVCNTTYKNLEVGGEIIFPPDETDEETAQNGEAWCVYDTRWNIENGTAPMGSRDWRHYCLYGKDYVEPCADYRQQVCMGNSDGSGQLGYSVCVDNSWASCSNISTKEDCNSNTFCYWWDEVRDYKDSKGNLFLNVTTSLSEINNWVVFGTTKEGMPIKPICLPRYPPGLDEGTNGFDNKEEICGNLGSYICQYKQSFWGADTFNSECLSDEFYTYMAHRCKSLGDCGTWFNYNKKNTSGFSVIEFDKKPDENSTNQTRGKKDLGLPEAYGKYLGYVESSWNEPSIKEATGWGKFGRYVGWFATTMGASFAGYLALTAVLAGATKLSHVGKILFSPAAVASTAGTTFQQGAVIGAGTALTVGSTIASGSLATGTQIISGTVKQGVVMFNNQLFEAAANNPLVIKQLATGGFEIAGGNVGSVGMQTAGIVTVNSPYAVVNEAVVGINAKVAGEGAATIATKATAVGMSKAAQLAGIVMGSLMVAAGIVMIILAFTGNRGPGFEQGSLIASGMSMIASGGYTIIMFAAGAAPVFWVVLGITVLVTAITALIYYASYDEKYYEVQCNPSLPPAGNEDCELCNNDANRPCSKYRCESLGQACMFVDSVNVSGTSYSVADGRCVAQQNTGKAPWITIVEARNVQNNEVVYLNSSLGTTPTTILIDMSNGTGKGIPDYTQLMIKINLSEDAVCKWDIQLTANFSDMDFPYESTVLRKELRQQFPIHQSIPYVYVRCANAYGNTNIAAYTFIFNVTAGPDLTPPVVTATDREYYNKFAFNVTQVPLTIYVNENSSCRWAKEDQEYGIMNNVTQCQSNLTLGGWKCQTNLTELISEPSGIVNPIYIRCNDTAGNEMQQSYLLKLFASPELKISSINPENGTQISGCNVSATVPLMVSTSDGSDSGNATCYWSTKGFNEGMKKFSITYANTHSTNAVIEDIPVRGTVTIYIKCVDTAFNNALAQINLDVYEDHDTPEIIRLYKEGNDLVLKTNEEAICSYHYSFGKKINTCIFAANKTLESEKFETTGSFEHRTSWDDKPWYVKCYDTCGNGVGKETDCTVIIPKGLD
ncbi:MAG: hypothetical protein NTX24_04675 [Candidatus Pacearchaeota archaeon]|nr:hypothetical protein [Candidatus Pacearchaeota archaeon]